MPKWKLEQTIQVRRDSIYIYRYRIRMNIKVYTFTWTYRQCINVRFEYVIFPTITIHYQIPYLHYQVASVYVVHWCGAHMFRLLQQHPKQSKPRNSIVHAFVHVRKFSYSGLVAREQCGHNKIRIQLHRRFCMHKENTQEGQRDTFALNAFHFCTP